MNISEFKIFQVGCTNTSFADVAFLHFMQGATTAGSTTGEPYTSRSASPCNTRGETLSRDYLGIWDHFLLANFSFRIRAEFSCGSTHGSAFAKIPGRVTSCSAMCIYIDVSSWSGGKFLSATTTTTTNHHQLQCELRLWAVRYRCGRLDGRGVNPRINSNALLLFTCSPSVSCAINIYNKAVFWTNLTDSGLTRGYQITNTPKQSCSLSSTLTLLQYGLKIA